MKYRLSTCVFLILIFSTCSNSTKDYITGSGVLEGTEVLISSKMSGQITDLDIQQGDVVKAGDIIAKIDSEKLLLQKEQILAGLGELDFNITNIKETILQAEENFHNIGKRFQRIKALFDNGSATQQQMDDIDTQYKAAQTGLKTARTSLQAAEMKRRQIEINLKLIDSQIADATVTSPISGVIVDKFIEPGEIIGAGLPIAAVADLLNLWVKLYVVETNLGHIQLGSYAEIAIDSFPDRKFSGKVTWISPKAEFTPKNVQTREARADLVYAVKIVLSNPDNILKIGMPVDIYLQK